MPLRDHVSEVGKPREIHQRVPQRVVEGTVYTGTAVLPTVVQADGAIAEIKERAKLAVNHVSPARQARDLAFQQRLIHG